jgi:4-diphosphocytidyl-2-C-methyl-D-erythritol kinase
MYNEYCIQNTTLYKAEVFMDNISLKALAKINLGLDVVRRREDGYHEVRMIMQTIHLYDKLEIKKTKEPGIVITSNLSYVPTNENNLVYKAAKMLIDEFDIQEGVSVNLIKRIPVAAGMAGGSSDAAAMLYGMNQIFDLKLSRKQLMERGVKIGADVPYCLMRGTALAEGIGEKLTQLPPMVKCPVLIAKPQISVSTKFVYENLKLNENTIHPDIDQLVTDIQNKDLPAIAGHMGNVLETVTIPEYPIIADIKNKMMESGAINSMMSGSGPTVFGLFADEETAKKAYKEMLSSGLAKQVYLTTIYNNRRE